MRSTRRSRTPSPTGPAAIKSYTADRLTYSPDPPACYGMIQFEDGGRWMMDFTDIDAGELEVGSRCAWCSASRTSTPSAAFAAISGRRRPGRRQ